MQEEGKGKSIVTYAMEYGIYLGLFLTVKFAVTTQSTRFVALNVLSQVLLLALPFVVYWLMRRFRNEMQGRAGFSQLWLFGIFLFFFGSLLSGVAEYAFYRFIDPLYLERLIASVLDTLGTLSRMQDSPFLEVMREGLEKGGAPSAIEMVYQTILSNVFFGSLLSMLLAWVLTLVNRK